jgi:hypothetical protein
LSTSCDFKFGTALYGSWLSPEKSVDATQIAARKIRNKMTAVIQFISSEPVQKNVVINLLPFVKLDYLIQFCWHYTFLKM